MNHQNIITQITNNKNTFLPLLSNLNNELINWKAGPDKWSILEIVNHLYDEEREDFRFRLKSVLENPEIPWPSINPAGWVKEREYSSRNFDSSLNDFILEREKSIEWLGGLINPNWHLSYNHPQIGIMSAEKILANWLAHDYLHMRQILRLKYEFLLKQVEPVPLNYAGNW